MPRLAADRQPRPPRARAARARRALQRAEAASRPQAPATATARSPRRRQPSARPVATTASAASSTGTTETPLEARKPTMAPVRDAVLLERLARRRRPRLGQVAKEVRLGGRDARDPLDVARSGTALQGVGDRLEGGLVDVERPAPRALARVDDPLVEFANPLLDCLDAGLADLRLSGRCWRPRPCSSGLRGTSRGLGGPGPCSCVASAAQLSPSSAVALLPPCAARLRTLETDGREPTSGDAGLEARDGERDALIWRPRSARAVAVGRTSSVGRQGGGAFGGRPCPSDASAPVHRGDLAEATHGQRAALDDEHGQRPSPRAVRRTVRSQRAQNASTSATSPSATVTTALAISSGRPRSPVGAWRSSQPDSIASSCSDRVNGGRVSVRREDMTDEDASRTDCFRFPRPPPVAKTGMVPCGAGRLAPLGAAALASLTCHQWAMRCRRWGVTRRRPCSTRRGVGTTATPAAAAVDTALATATATASPGRLGDLPVRVPLRMGALSTPSIAWLSVVKP